MIPLFLFFFFAGFIPCNYLFALIIFSAASVTDTLDGRIARKRGLVTDFGKLMDPLADKLLVMSALVVFITVGKVHALITIIILAREFIVTGMRQLAAGKGMVLAADGFGKLKTAFQMIWICYDLFTLFLTENTVLTPDFLMMPMTVLHYILLICALIMTILSGINYLWRNRALIADAKSK